ncbi:MULTISPECIES: hypothetical protein [Streptomyces]|uniref:hypothetical protein n=1 Tax=Streptomyces TaxID=1883 RepID=UPI000EB2844E|nr:MULTISPECIES: hypothetical protein [Streptomyces]MCX4438291.1 hypothetical protein [Streptomyces mirabilis]
MSHASLIGNRRRTVVSHSGSRKTYTNDAGPPGDDPASPAPLAADPAHLAGSLTKGPDFGAVLAQARTARHDGMRLIPCDGVPLVLVVLDP